MELIVDENFGAVWVGRNGYNPDAIGSGRRGGVCRLGRVIGFGECCLARCCSGTLPRSGDIRIETAKDLEKVGGAERKTDAIGIFLDELQRVDADDFPARVEERAATVASIDGSSGLNPCSLSGVREFSNDADQAFRDAEKHGVAGIADSERGINLRGWAFYLSQRDIEAVQTSSATVCSQNHGKREQAGVDTWQTANL